MFLHLTIYTIIIMKILWSKLPRYTWSCFWNMNFLVRFYYFWKYRFLLILKVFICECLHQILPWKEIKEAFPRRLQNKKLFLPKQNPGCPNKEYNAVFKHIHQNIKAYWRKQKVCTDQWLGKYQFIQRRIQAKCRHKSVVCSTYSCAVWGIVRLQENLAVFPLI